MGLRELKLSVDLSIGGVKIDATGQPWSDGDGIELVKLRFDGQGNDREPIDLEIDLTDEDAQTLLTALQVALKT